MKILSWQTSEAPHDREIVLIGNLIGHFKAEHWAEPVTARAQWSDAAQDWVFTSNGLVIRQDITDELVIHAWIDLPYGADGRVQVPKVPAKAVKEIQEVPLPSGHTPGPWEVVDRHPQRACLEIISTHFPGHTSLASLSLAPDDHDFQTDTGVWTNDPIRQANAKLMAASPELLAATSAAECFVRGFEDDEAQDGIPPLLGQLRRAIAKAGGRVQ